MQSVLQSGFQRIIRSILDNDLYKFTMAYAALVLYPDVLARYRFVNRGKTEFPPGFAERLQEQVDSMKSLRLTKSERNFIVRKCYYLPTWFADWLRDTFRYDPSQIKISQNGGRVEITVEGVWHTAIFWEVPLMAIVSELYFEMMGIKPDKNLMKRTLSKGEMFLKARVLLSDFGTRRRFSHYVHMLVVRTLKRSAGEYLVGTSNLYLAKKYNLTPIGTYAHEWVQAHAAMFGYVMADRMAMEAWAKVFGAALGTALADTYTTESFFFSFDTYLAKLFDGVRHDSGDPYEFIDRVIEHYRKLRIDPATKTIVFSDGLTPELALAIAAYCREKGIRAAFGIGTNLTNDIYDEFGNRIKPLNIVVKAFEFFVPRFNRWVKTCKLSNDPGKKSGDPRAIEAAEFDLLGIVKEENA